MHSALRIRCAGSGDLTTVTTLEESLFGHLSYPFYLFRQIHEAYPSTFCVAEEAGDIVGYVIAIPAEDGITGWFWSVGVRADHARRGIGRQLVGHTLKGMRSSGIKQAFLSVDPGNAAAIALYTGLGFQTARTEADYLGPGEHRLIMETTIP